MHDKNVIHRRLELSSLYVDDDYCVRIGGFGNAALLKNRRERRFSLCGEPMDLAPEMIQATRFDGHSFEVDIWAVGVITVLLLTGKHPFFDVDASKTYENIKEGAYDKSIET